MYATIIWMLSLCWEVNVVWSEMFNQKTKNSLNWCINDSIWTWFVTHLDTTKLWWCLSCRFSCYDLILGISGICGSATQRIGDGYTVDINLSSQQQTTHIIFFNTICGQSALVRIFSNFTKMNLIPFLLQRAYYIYSFQIKAPLSYILQCIEIVWTSYAYFDSFLFCFIKFFYPLSWGWVGIGLVSVVNYPCVYYFSNLSVSL